MKNVAFLFLWFMVFSIPWQAVITVPGLGTITRLIGFGSICIAGLYVLIKKSIKEPPIFLILMLLFILWSAISYLWSINPPSTIQRTVTNIQLFIMVWLMWELCDSKEKVYSIMQAFVFGAYIAIIDMIVKFLSSPTGATRIGATGMNVNEMAIIIAMAIPIAWYLYLRQQRGLFAWINLLYVPLSLFGVILTASRGGLLVACTALLIIPLTIFYIQRTARYAITVILVLIIVSGVFYLPEIYPKLEANVERLQGTAEEVREGTLTGRTVIWKAGLDVFKNHPIIGVGATGFRYAIMGAPVDVTTGSRPDFLYTPKAPHNSFLSVLVDTGLIGFILFIAIFGVAVIPTLLSKSLELKFYFLLFITLTIGLLPINWESHKVTWYVLALFPLHSTLIIQQGKFRIIKRYLH